MPFDRPRQPKGKIRGALIWVNTACLPPKSPQWLTLGTVAPTNCGAPAGICLPERQNYSVTTGRVELRRVMRKPENEPPSSETSTETRTAIEASEEGLRLISAFLRIRDPTLRAVAIDLISKLAERSEQA